MTPIIENGVLRNYCTVRIPPETRIRPDWKWKPRGFGVVSIGPTNFYLKGGSKTPEKS